MQPIWVSDHLCFTGLRGQNMHDLLPLPYTEEALDHIAERVLAVQDHLGRRLVLENVSSYVTYAASELSEWEFIAELARRADCEILLDVNNVYVSAFNHEFDALAFLRGMPRERVRQFHLAGHTTQGQPHHRHPRPSHRAGCVGALRRGAAAVPRRADHDRARRQHPALCRALLAELDVARGIAAVVVRQAAWRHRRSSANAGSPRGDLQRAFQDYVLANSEAVSGGGARHAEGRPHHPARRLSRRLCAAPDRGADHRLSRPDGDGGPADFDHMARAYIAAHPSRHPSVRWYGKDVADFLAATPPYNRTSRGIGDGTLRMGAGRGVRFARR